MEYEHREGVKDSTQFDSQTFFREHLQRTDDGKLEIQGNDLSPVEMALLETEKRRRGSQAAVTREQNKASRFELELAQVKEKIPQMETRAPIDESLKYSDPDEYIRQSLEAKRSDPYEEVFDAASQYAQQTVGEQSVARVIEDYNQANPKTPLTEQMLDNDIPPRMLQELASGHVTPQDFLARAGAMLYGSGDSNGNQDIPVTPDLGNVGGTTTPTDDGSNDAMAANYAKAVF